MDYTGIILRIIGCKKNRELFLDNRLLTALCAHATEDLSPEIDPLRHWWKAHKSALPKWANAIRKVLLLQPSSVAAECVFSLLSNSFSSHQDSSLED